MKNKTTKKEQMSKLKIKRKITEKLYDKSMLMASRYSYRINDIDLIINGLQTSISTKLLDKQLKDNLTARTHLRLRANGVEKVRELIAYSSKELLLFRGLSETSLKEIKDFLLKNKLKLTEN